MERIILEEIEKLIKEGQLKGMEKERIIRKIEEIDLPIDVFGGGVRRTDFMKLLEICGAIDERNRIHLNRVLKFSNIAKIFAKRLIEKMVLFQQTGLIESGFVDYVVSSDVFGKVVAFELNAGFCFLNELGEIPPGANVIRVEDVVTPGLFSKNFYFPYSFYSLKDIWGREVVLSVLCFLEKIPEVDYPNNRVISIAEFRISKKSCRLCRRDIPLDLDYNDYNYKL